MRLALSFAALLLAILLLQTSSGGVGPLDALSGVALGFSTQQIGLMGSAHFFGFLIGCWWAPRLMGSVGHARGFAAFTAVGTIAILAHMLVLDPYVWAFLRIGTGLCIAGCYTIVEAWLNAKCSNHNRGQVMGAYRFVDMGGSLMAQLLIAVLTPAHYISYNLLAIICCAALLPLVLTTVKQPETPAAPRLRPGLILSISPLAVVAVAVAALTSASFRMVGPLYAQAVGFQASQIALFLAAFVAGGALAQFPVGWLADRFDRRWVLVFLSFAAIGSSGVVVMASAFGGGASYLASFLFGLVTFPIFSVAAAHANDFATNEQRVELAAGLMFFFALGAISSPIIASWLIGNFGANAMFGFIAIAHAALAIISLVRMLGRPTSDERTPYVYTPRSSFLIGRLLGRR